MNKVVLILLARDAVTNQCMKTPTIEGKNLVPIKKWKKRTAEQAEKGCKTKPLKFLVSLVSPLDGETIFIRNYKMSVTKVFLSNYFKLLALLHRYFCVQYRFIYDK